MSYISQEDYKKMMENFKTGAPKGMLKEALDPVGKEDSDIDNDGDVDKTDKYLAKRRQAVGKAIGKGRMMKETHPENDKWYEDFENGLRNLANNKYISQFELQQYMKALDHVDPMDNYSEFDGHDAAKEFVDDLRTKNQMDADDEQWKSEHGGYDFGGDDFNDGEFWENEIKKLQEIAGVGPQDDGPEDDDEEEREARAKKAEMDDEEAENAERDLDEEEEKLYLRAPEQAAKHIAKKYGAELKPEYDEYQKSHEEYMQAIRQYDNKDPKFREITTAHNRLVKDYQNKVLGLARQEMEDSGEKPVVARNLAYGYSDEDWPSEFVTALAKEMKGMQESLNEGSNYEDPHALAKAIALAHPELQKFALEDRKMFHRAAFKYASDFMTKAGIPKQNQVYLVNDEDWSMDYISALGEELEGMQEGLHMPPLQATGPTVSTNEGLHMPPLQATGNSAIEEDQAPFGMSVLSPDERNQLKEYITHYRTIKAEIAKLLEKAGKSGKIMEATAAEDEAVPAERKAKYKDPTTVPTQKHKHSNLGGDRTGLVMTKAEMWEGEEHETMEDSLGEKLHHTFNTVTKMAIKRLVADGWDEDQAVSFLQIEIEEHAKEATMSQYDPH